MNKTNNCPCRRQAVPAWSRHVTQTNLSHLLLSSLSLPPQKGKGRRMKCHRSRKVYRITEYNTQIHALQTRMEWQWNRNTKSNNKTTTHQRTVVKASNVWKIHKVSHEQNRHCTNVATNNKSKRTANGRFPGMQQRESQQQQPAMK